MIGLVGSTGSGKTTILDLIMGLLEPTEGVLLVDNQIIDDRNLRSWQKNIGYVPQHIYLADDSIAANIALGREANEVIQLNVEHAAKIANLHDFIINELPDGYKTIVGERGVRLSGGQRQRIGIARSLYHNPKVLIFDEATSALDSLTERAVIDAIDNLKNKITVVLVTHRLSTVERCDLIYLLSNGTICDKGTYAQLMNTNTIFRKMSSGDHSMI